MTFLPMDHNNLLLSSATASSSLAQNHHQEFVLFPFNFITAVLSDWSSILPQPLLFSLLAGLSTCIGAASAFLVDNTRQQSSSSSKNDSQLAFSLALAGSVMLTVSFASILPEAFHNHDNSNNNNWLSFGSLLFNTRLASVAIGCGLYLLLSTWIFPEPEDVLGLATTTTTTTTTENQPMYSESIALPPSGPILSMDTTTTTIEAQRAWRVAMLLFVSLAVHNFPEGLAVAASTMHSSRLGLTTTIAIALHNIPEGIAIAIPCIAARPDAPWLAFGLASLSGLAEPLGAAVAMAAYETTQTLPVEYMHLWDMNNLLAFVAGIMIMVAVRELIPEAARHSKDDKVPFVLGALLGACIMLVTESYLEV